MPISGHGTAIIPFDHKREKDKTKGGKLWVSLN
jgi:hypothetical protein